MFDKYIYSFLNWLMGVAGAVNSWAWVKHVKLIEKKRQKENEKYLKELKKKL